MSRVLMTFESSEPTNQESYKIFCELQNKGKIQLRTKRCIEISNDDLKWCDVIFSIRSTSSMEASLAKYTRKLGKYWILLLDDDFLSLGKDYGQDGQGYREAKKRCLKTVLQNTDCLMVSNLNLIKKYSEYGNFKRTYKGETAVDCEQIVAPQKAGERIKIVYYVNDGTTAMIDKYLRPVFYRLAEIYSQKISLYFMAVHPDLHELDEALDIHYVPHMGFDDFLKYISEQHFDIGLAPLDDQGFSKFKYINKFIEYTRAGVAGIYSDCELYKSVIVSGENGILCDNSVEGWVNAIGKLIKNDELKIQIASNAQKYVRNHMSKEAVIQLLVDSIPELENYKAPNAEIKEYMLLLIRFQYYLFRVRGWFFTFYSCIRTGNVKGLFRRVARKLKKGG